MQKCTSVIVALSFFIVTACGQVGPKPFTSQMSEQEALSVLSQVQTEESAAANNSSSDVVTVENVQSVIQDLVESGQLRLPSTARGAIKTDGSLNTETLNKVLTMLSQGMNAFQVARGVVAAASGNTAKAKLDLDAIAAILQAALPFIIGVAPQFAPIIQAMIAMLPVIKAFIAILKKPTPAPTAYWLPDGFGKMA